MGEFNLHTIPAREMSPRRLEEAVDCLPMMAPRTLVLVRDFDLFKAGEKDREEYARAFAQLPDYCCLVFVYDLIPYKGGCQDQAGGGHQAERDGGQLRTAGPGGPGGLGCAGASGRWARRSTPGWPAI